MNETIQAEALSCDADPRWSAVLRRDPDAAFFYSVRSTGVFCRPSCSARPPRPTNVAFHATAADAERAGFRPCKRCRPTEAPRAEREAAIVAELCRMIETAENLPSVDELADRARVSPSRVHRLFKAVTGITPKAYASAHRASRVREQLRRAPSVTEAIYESGFQSNARFYERSSELLGMTPSRFRRGGESLEIRYATGRCSLGSILVAATATGVCAILLGEDRAGLETDLAKQFPNGVLSLADEDFERTVAAVVTLVDQPTTCFDLPLDIRGTVFQQRVWKALQGIPAGSTVTYQELARTIGSPRSVRAVARACASNKLAVAVPCHRVVRGDGSLAGYRWGVQRKRALLERESEAAT